MNELKEEKYLIKTNSYMIDLAKVDFITWKENDKKENTYWAKFHIGTKEARYVCDGIEELRTILETWSKLNGKKVEIEDEDIIEEW